MEVEVEAALQYLVSKSRPFEETRGKVKAEVEAEAHGPLCKPLSAKVHVGFRDGTVSQRSDYWSIATALRLKSLDYDCCAALIAA